MKAIVFTKYGLPEVLKNRLYDWITCLRLQGGLSSKSKIIAPLPID